MSAPSTGLDAHFQDWFYAADQQLKALKLLSKEALASEFRLFGFMHEIVIWRIRHGAIPEAIAKEYEISVEELNRQFALAALDACKAPKEEREAGPAKKKARTA